MKRKYRDPLPILLWSGVAVMLLLLGASFAAIAIDGNRYEARCHAVGGTVVELNYRNTCVQIARIVISASSTLI